MGSEPHGVGNIIYANNDRYSGTFFYGKFDGYGTYTYDDGSSYTGFFSYGQYNGTGTYENDDIILQGEWRNDKKHGGFFITNKKKFTTSRQIWVDDRRVSNIPMQYMAPNMLRTENKPSMIRKEPTLNHDKKCITCIENAADATNNLCGHVCMCYGCLMKVDECPICRCPINLVLKLYTI